MSQRGSAMLQRTYAAALWYLSYILPVGHTNICSSEAVSGNESSVITGSFGNESKHARSSETAKDCSATVSNNSFGSIITARGASDSEIAERSNDSERGSEIAQRSASDSVSATTASFGNESKHARSSETAKDCSATVSKNSVSGSVIAARSASDSVIAGRSKDSARGSVIAQRSASDSVSAITASFGNESKHARSSETAKDCSETVSKNSVSGSVIAVRSASDSVIAERSKDSARGSVIAQRSAGHSVSAITASFGNESKHGVQKSS